MVKKTRKQKEKAAKRRKYLAKLAEPAAIEKKIPKEVPKIKEEVLAKIQEVKPIPSFEYIISDFKKALFLSGLFIAILIILAFLETKYGFLGPLASKLMERLVGG